MEWLAGEKTKVVGTFPPRARGWMLRKILQGRQISILLRLVIFMFSYNLSSFKFVTVYRKETLRAVAAALDIAY
jgi:hypothetical protein